MDLSHSIQVQKNVKMKRKSKILPKLTETAGAALTDQPYIQDKKTKNKT